MDTEAVRLRLREARGAAGKTQAQIGEVLDVAPSTVSGYERGRFPITLEVLHAYEQETERPLEWLLRGDREALAKSEVMAAVARMGDPPPNSADRLDTYPGFQALAADAALLAGAGVTPEELSVRARSVVAVDRDPTKEEVLSLILFLRRWGKG